MPNDQPARGAVLHAPPPRQPKPAEPCAMVIFGAFGDLTKRLVMPALYNLMHTGILPDGFSVIGADLADGTAESWRDHLFGMMKTFVGNKSSEFDVDSIDQAAWDKLAGRMSYVKGDMTKPELYGTLTKAVDRAEREHGGDGNALFYLAVADRFFGDVVDQLGASKLVDQQEDGDGKRKRWRRVVIEKPFGHDVSSAKALNTRILRSLREDQIFRIDHFLGKETVQNIMALRFANGLFEPIWNRERIDHVQITVAETVGVEARGKFYEVTGALRDMVPNHVFTLLSMVAMEPPTSFDAESIRNKKAEMFQAMAAARPADAVRGQYGAGKMDGQDCKPYREEPDVARDSDVETYVAMQLKIDNWRWSGVPFYLRTGKHMADRMTEIAIRFKQAPYAPFENTDVAALAPNWLVIRLSPDEGISLQFEVKQPGQVMRLAAVRMDFNYADWFPREPNVGYETLLYDVMNGDATLFQRADMVESTWRIVQPVLDALAADKAAFPNYDSGSQGPADADALIARDGKRAWRPVSVEAQQTKAAKAAS